MEKSTSSPSEATGHLELEQLAAFLDGELGEDENGRVRLHLAECEDCTQVLLTADEFLKEEERREQVGEDVRPFGEPSAGGQPPMRPRSAHPLSERRRHEWGRRLAVAATVVLAVGAGTFGYRWLRAPGVPVEGLASADLVFPVDRGAGSTASQQRALALGARSLELQVRLARQEDVGATLSRIAGLLEGDPSLRRFVPQGTDREAARRFLESDLRQELVDPQWFDLGQWAQAGQAASRARREDLLREGWNGAQHRRRLKRLLEEKEGPLPPHIHNRLGQIRSFLVGRELDFPRLEAAYLEILSYP